MILKTNCKETHAFILLWLERDSLSEEFARVVYGKRLPVAKRLAG